MAPDSQITAGLPNWLDGNRIPAELKMIILEHTSHSDLRSLLHAYPTWVSGLWNQYPKQLLGQALENVFEDIDEKLMSEVFFVYHIRKIRKNYTIAMGSSEETQLQRDKLQAELREFLSSSGWPDLDKSLQTIFDIGDIIRDVNSLTYRYSNDAWKRIHDIFYKFGGKPCDSSTRDSPPAINLSRMERCRFNRAFLRVEIYLLTKYWTNAQDQRHILDMGKDIEGYIPDHDLDRRQREEFDSCLRYIFHAHRGYLKDTARDMGAPELPTRDDLQWVPNRFEEKVYQYRDSYSAYQTLEHDDPKAAFSQRSVSEEQRFLLWHCELGISHLEQIHKTDERTRRDELILQFSRRHIWDTVELRHRVSRYDVQSDQGCALSTDESHEDQHRNRHPVMSLYGQDAHLRYCNITPPWACARAFLSWVFVDAEDYTEECRREGVALDDQGCWLMLSDTDRGFCDWNHLQTKGTKGTLGFRVVPYGHPYMLDPAKYEVRVMPHRVSV